MINSQIGKNYMENAIKQNYIVSKTQGCPLEDIMCYSISLPLATKTTNLLLI